MSTTPTTKRTLVLEEFGKGLTLKESPLPAGSPPAGTVLVQVLTSTVRPHYRDGFGGKQILPFPLPYTPGNAGVGRVISAGPDAVSLRAGQLVLLDGCVRARDDPGAAVLMGMFNMGGPRTAGLFDAWPGLFSSVAYLPLENCLPLDEGVLCGPRMGYSPADLTYVERMGLGLAAVRAAGLHPGHTVVVAPSTGQYSGVAAEMAAQVGCRVVAVTRSPANLGRLADLYPDRVVPLVLAGDVDADVATVAELCPSGVDAYIDVSPPALTAHPHHFAVGVASVRPGGTVVLLGALGDVSVPYASLMLRGVSVKGQFMYSRSQLADVIKMVETGVVRLGPSAGHETVGGPFGLDDWDQAVRAAETATKWGQQVVLSP